MATLTQTPHTNDAKLRKNGGGTFAGVRGGTTATSIQDAGATTVAAQVDNQSDFTNFYFDRPVLPFDTSAIGSGGTVTAGTLDVNVTASSSPGTVYIDLVAINLASPPTIATTDWQYVGTTQLATRLSFASGFTGAKTFTLNSSGLAAINKTGYTGLCIVMGNDFANSDSSPQNLGFGYAPYYTYCLISSADAGSNLPTLNLTYTTPGASLAPVRRDTRLLPFYSFPD